MSFWKRVFGITHPLAMDARPEMRAPLLPTGTCRAVPVARRETGQSARQRRPPALLSRPLLKKESTCITSVVRRILSCDRLATIDYQLI